MYFSVTFDIYRARSIPLVFRFSHHDTTGESLLLARCPGVLDERGGWNPEEWAEKNGTIGSGPHENMKGVDFDRGA